MAMVSSFCLCVGRFPDADTASPAQRGIAKLLVFLVLSVLDLFLTWHLVHGADGWVYESNPLASWWLERWGWLGLIFFKVSAVSVVSWIWYIVTPLRPRLANMVLSFACATLALVVLYSTSLASFVETGADDTGVGSMSVAAAGERLDKRMAATRAYEMMQDQLARDLVAGRCSLKDAMALLLELERSHDPMWLGMLHRDFPDLTDRQSMAKVLVLAALDCVPADAPNAASVTGRLDKELQREFGVSSRLHK
jgi:hypothetical protein